MENNSDIRNPDGTLKAGHSGLKQKGAIHEKTRIWNEIKEWYTGEGLERYQSILTEMMESGDEKQRAFAMQRYEAMMEYFAPKLSRTEVKADIKGEIKPLIEWTD